MQEFNFKGIKYNSPVELALNTIGGKWKMQIIWLLQDDPKRYGELKKLLSKVTHKMLTLQLRELEQDEIISRKIYPEVPPKVEYKLTLLGKSILPIIDLLNDWGEEYKSVFGQE
ncbi:MAG: winged helix-turn-helix transcriptional regulator [Ignavibacteriales bacterium]